MGPPRSTNYHPPEKSGKKCLLCRGNADSNISNRKLKTSCAVSFCTIFGLPDSHPFKYIFENANYCQECFNEVKEADATLGKVEILKQSLLRFQDNVYTKFGDNYFQIEDKDELNVSYKEFEKGGDEIRGKKFSYNEIIKIIYEKLDQECLKWGNFFSETTLCQNEKLLAPVVEKEVIQKVDACTQTKSDIIIVEAIAEGSITIPNVVDATGHEVILPTVTVDHHVDVGEWDTGNDGASMVEDSNSAEADPLDSLSTRKKWSIGAATPEISFTQPPANFEQTISCTYDPENCKRFFYDEYNLKVHIKSFHEGNPRPHECSSCNKAFSEEGRLKTHFLRVHSSGGSFMCEHCGRGFSCAPLLRDHLRKLHTNRPAEIYYCPFCGASFHLKEGLQDHEALHRARKSPFDCVYCEKLLPNSTAAKEHYLNEHSDSSFRCDRCFKVLSNLASLKSHMKLHSDRFKCDECDFVAASESGIKTHKLSHSNEKPHTCDVCGTCYKYAKNLTAHMRMHTGEKPYICSVCGASFREHSYLKRHEETHSAECLYSCRDPNCEKKFKTREGSKKHYRSVHLGIKKKRKPSSKAKSGSPSKKKKKTVLKSPVKTENDEEVEHHSPVSRQSPKKELVIPKKKSVKLGRPSLNKKPKKKIGIKIDSLRKRTYKVENDVEIHKIEEVYSGHEESMNDDELNQDELNGAVASIEVPTSSIIPNATVVYGNHYEVYGSQPATVEILPVTVVTTQGVNIVNTTGAHQGEVQFRVEYKYN